MKPGSLEVQEVRGRAYKELSLAEQEGIYELERMDLDGEATRLILAAFLGYKFSDLGVIEKTPKELEKAEHEMETIFTNLGLNVLKETALEGPDDFSTSYLVGKKEIPEGIRKQLDELRKTDLDRFHREYGALMGMPQTAIEDFLVRLHANQVGVETKDDDKKPYDLETERFAWFVPSAEHWEEEAKPVKKFAEKVKGISSKLYERILSDYSTPRQIARWQAHLADNR
jgi:hypothetical protein